MLEQETFLGGARIRNVAIATATAIGLLMGAAAPASAWLIDFEGLTTTGAGTSSGLIIDDEYSAGGITGGGSLTATFGAFTPSVPGSEEDPTTWNSPRQAVLYDSDGPVTGGDADLLAPFENRNQPLLGDLNPGHILILHEHPGDCNATVCSDPDDIGARPAGRHIIEFNQDIVLESIDFFDVEVTEGFPPPLEKYEIALFDSAGVQIDNNMFYTPDTDGDNTWDQVDFGNLSGVRKIEIRMGGSGAIDNIKGSFTQVSEPAGFGLLAFGVIAMGSLHRRRNRGLRAAK